MAVTNQRLAVEAISSLKKHHQDLKGTTSLLVHIYIRLLVYHSLNKPHSQRVLHTVYTHTIHEFLSPYFKSTPKIDLAKL